MRICEHYAWFDFKEILLDEIFSKDEVAKDLVESEEFEVASVELEEVGHYDFSAKVHIATSEGMEIAEVDREEVEKLWFRYVEDCPVYEMHVDNRGVWVVYDKEVSVYE